MTHQQCDKYIKDFNKIKHFFKKVFCFIGVIYLISIGVMFNFSYICLIFTVLSF